MIKEGIYIINHIDAANEIIHLNSDYPINELTLLVTPVGNNDLDSLTIQCDLSNPDLGDQTIPFVQFTFPNLTKMEKKDGAYVLELDSDFVKATKDELFKPETHSLTIAHQGKSSETFKVKVEVK